MRKSCALLLAFLLNSGCLISWAADNAPATNVATKIAAEATATNAAGATNSHEGGLAGAIKQATAGTTMIQDKILTYLIENGPKLIGAAMVLLIGILIARQVGKLVMRWLTKKEMEPPVRMLITRIGKLFIVGFALVIALGTLGFNIMALVTGIGVAGVGVSLATQGVLSNLVAGLTIIFTKPFRVGEYIEVTGVYGQVLSIELFSTTLQHFDRSKVVIPNRRIVGEVLHNYGTIRQLELSVGVSYDTKIEDALEVIREVLRGNSRILKEFTPVVGVSQFADSSINIAVKPWVAVVDYIAAEGELNLALAEKLRQRNIQMPFPQREIRILNGEK